MKIKTISLLLLLVFLCSCHVKQEDHATIQPTNKVEFSTLTTFIDASFPLKISEINFLNSSNELDSGCFSKIQETVRNYISEFDLALEDSIYKEVYFNTIRLRDSLHTLFFVLLKHYPSGELNCKVLFYTNKSKTFAKNTFDFNLWAMYNIDNKSLQPSELKQSLKITQPEVELVDYNKDGINDFKFIRLIHNGTYNALQTTILSIQDNRLDTLYFIEQTFEN